MAYAPQLTNVGKRGQDARYDITGLPQVAPGVYSDGTYQYDARGLDLSGRKAENISGLRGADENFVDGQYSYASGGGGGGGGFTPAGVYALDAQRAKLAYDRAVAAANTGQQNLNKNLGVTNVKGKMQIDPYNEFGSLRMLLGNIGGSINDAYDTASERHIGHRGLGAQGVSQARRLGSAQVSNLGDQYLQTFAQYEQSKQNALAEYNLAKQLAEYYANMNGSWYGGGGGWDPGGSPEDVQRQQLAAAMAPAYQNRTAKVGQYQPNGKVINTGGGFYTGQQNDDLTAKWKRLAGIA